MSKAIKKTDENGLHKIGQVANFQFQLTEKGEIPKEIQILKTGTFHHPWYGKFVVTEDTMRSFKRNFDADVIGRDLTVDYDHEGSKDAAAWVEDIILKENDTQLWFKVEWTPDGKKVILDKNYRYTSAEYDSNYTDNETLIEYGSTILGAALTNRPFIKRMNPVMHEPDLKDENLKEDKNLKNLQEKNKMDEIENLKVQLNETKELNKKFSSELEKLNSEVAKLLSEKKELEKEKILSEKKGKFDKLLSEGKVIEAQRESYMLGDIEKMIELNAKLNLSEKGTDAAKSGEEGKDASEIIDFRARKSLSEKGIKNPSSEELIEEYKSIMENDEKLAKEYATK